MKRLFTAAALAFALTSALTSSAALAGTGSPDYMGVYGNQNRTASSAKAEVKGTGIQKGLTSIYVVPAGVSATEVSGEKSDSRISNVFGVDLDADRS